MYSMVLENMLSTVVIGMQMFSHVKEFFLKEPNYFLPFGEIKPVLKLCSK